MNTAGTVLLRGGVVWELELVVVVMATWAGNAGGGAAEKKGGSVVALYHVERWNGAKATQAIALCACLNRG